MNPYLPLRLVALGLCLLANPAAKAQRIDPGNGFPPGVTPLAFTEGSTAEGLSEADKARLFSDSIPDNARKLIFYTVVTQVATNCRTIDKLTNSRIEISPNGKFDLVYSDSWLNTTYTLDDGSQLVYGLRSGTIAMERIPADRTIRVWFTDGFQCNPGGKDRYIFMNGRWEKCPSCSN